MNVISYGLGAKLLKAFEDMGATPEILNHLAENGHQLRDPIEKAKFAIEENSRIAKAKFTTEEHRRIETLESFPIRGIASFAPGTAFRTLSEKNSALKLRPNFLALLHDRIDSSIDGRLTSVRLLKPTNYRHIKKHLTPSAHLVHVYHLLSKLLFYTQPFRNGKIERHVFLTTWTTGAVLQEGSPEMAIGILVFVSKDDVVVDTFYVNDNTFIGNGTIVHSFVAD
jgi:hypothetical protein